MSSRRFELEDFTATEGTSFEVSVNGSFLFLMTLIDVRQGKLIELPKWKTLGDIRRQPFSLFFESDRKVLVKKDTVVSGGVFEAYPLKIEPIDESPSGYIYQACFG